MTDGDSGGAAPTLDTPALATTPHQNSPASAPRSTIKTAAEAAHWNGLHAAYGDIHCPVCINQGYVGSGYDRERVPTGSAQ